LGGSESWRHSLNAKQPPGNKFENYHRALFLFSHGWTRIFTDSLKEIFSIRVSGACPELAEWVLIRG
jgi:hypothetical protein